jgi:5-methyltetrahydropteroyltriglutamate--homocysteine methyltransferase
MQARVEKARDFAVEAIGRALEGASGTTALHTCFGYGAMVKEKTVNTYAFLEELVDTPVQQLSIEAAQPKLDLSVLGRLGDKTVILGVLDLGTEDVETADAVADRIRAALRFIGPERLVIAPDCGMKYLSRRAAFGKLRAMVEGTHLVRADLAAAETTER